MAPPKRSESSRPGIDRRIRSRALCLSPFQPAPSLRGFRGSRSELPASSVDAPGQESSPCSCARLPASDAACWVPTDHAAANCSASTHGSDERPSREPGPQLPSAVGRKLSQLLGGQPASSSSSKSRGQGNEGEPRGARTTSPPHPGGGHVPRPTTPSFPTSRPQNPSASHGNRRVRQEGRREMRPCAKSSSLAVAFPVHLPFGRFSRPFSPF
jgi:hypothetical protein